MKFLTASTRRFEDTDASLVEINPFITTTDGRLFALDAKMNFDDNALFRHPDLQGSARRHRRRSARSRSRRSTT